MKIGFLYAGQGSQEVGMGLDFYEKSPLAKEIYDSFPFAEKIQELSFYSKAEILKETQNTQISLVAFQVMVTDLLRVEGIYADGACGLSIGEYGGLYGAGVLSQEDVIKIADFRGRAMSQCANKLQTKMYALLSSDRQSIVHSMEKYNTRDNFVEISNINSPKQIVISGQAQVAEKVVDDLREKNIKAMELNVSGPFHTSYMEPAGQKLGEFLKEIPFEENKIDIFLNRTGKKYAEEDLKKIMEEQVSHTVLFSNNIEEMIESGIDTYIEIGFHKVLQKIVKKMDSRARIFSIATYEDYLKCLEEIHV